MVVGAPPKATSNLLADVVTRCARLERSPIVTDMASIKGFVIDGPQQDYERFVRRIRLQDQSTAAFKRLMHRCFPVERSF